MPFDSAPGCDLDHTLSRNLAGRAPATNTAAKLRRELSEYPSPASVPCGGRRG